MRDRTGDFSYYSEGKLLDFFSEPPTPAVSVERLSLLDKETDVYRTALLGSAVASRAGSMSQVLTVSDAPEIAREGEFVVVPTGTIFVEGARSADLRWCWEELGAEV